jgi:hypothetical protein
MAALMGDAPYYSQPTEVKTKVPVVYDPLATPLTEEEQIQLLLQQASESVNLQPDSRGLSLPDEVTELSETDAVAQIMQQALDEVAMEKRQGKRTPSSSSSSSSSDEAEKSEHSTDEEL